MGQLAHVPLILFAVHSRFSSKVASQTLAKRMHVVIVVQMIMLSMFVTCVFPLFCEMFDGLWGDQSCWHFFMLVRVPHWVYLAFFVILCIAAIVMEKRFGPSRRTANIYLAVVLVNALVAALLVASVFLPAFCWHGRGLII